MISCPSCGGSLRFDIVSQKMLCDHCDSYFEVEQLSDDSNRDDSRASSFDCYVYLCPSCGAEIMTTDKNDAIGFCQYCGGASLIFDKIRQEWKPDTIIPFQITKEQCKQAYCKEVRRQIFVSKKYRNAELIESFRGIYMPYWNYHADMSGAFQIRTVTPQRKIDSRTYEKIHYDIIGQSNYHTEGYSRDASISFDDDLSESLSPYKIDGQKPFRAGYLSGFYAETGNVNPHTYDVAVIEEMKEDAIVVFQNDSTIADCMKYNTLKLRPPEESNIPIKVESVSRTLNPVWFMSYRNGNTITYATVNGQTGKVSADLPLSPLRILIFALGISALIFLALLMGMEYIPSIKANVTLTLCSLLAGTGMFKLQLSFNRTVDKVSDRQPTGCFGRHSYTFAVIIAIISMIAFTSDYGSYEQQIASITRISLMISCIYMMICHIALISDTRKVKQVQLNNNSMLRARIVEEAKKFLSNVFWLKAGMYFTLVISVIVIILDLAFSLITYGMCLIIALELFALALLHIHFQTQVAKRPLPQFNKRGAYYDENS